MPSVPVIFNYQYSPGAFGDIAVPANNWRLRCNSIYGDFNVTRVRYTDGTDLSPFSLSVDLETMFPVPATPWAHGTTVFDGQFPNTEAESYFEAVLTYPDDLDEVFFRLDIHTGGDYGFLCTYTSPRLSPWFYQPPPESEELPSVDPALLQLTLEHPTVPGGCRALNRSLSTLDVTGTVLADYGDGTSASQAFSYTLPAATIDYHGTGFGGLVSEIDRVPILQVVTDDSITEPAAAVVLVNTATSYLVEIRLPRFSHYYETINNPNPALSVKTNVGWCRRQELDPIPVANFEAADGEDITELDYLHLDGSKSFDLTDVVDVWAWYWTRYVEGVDPGLEPTLTFSHSLGLTPILSAPSVLPGDYWVYLIVGNDGSLTPSFTPFYRYRQRSIARRKHVTVGGGTGVALDDKRMSWWHLTGSSGVMKVKRHLQFEAPGTGGVSVGAGVPGAITLAGAHLFVTSKTGRFYTSDDEGATWEFIMVIAPNVSLVAKAAAPDGATVYHLVLSAGDVLQRVVVRRNGSGWVADAPEPVTGLPASTRRPGDADMAGAYILLTARSDDGVFAATSTDGMKTWTVSE